MGRAKTLTSALVVAAVSVLAALAIAGCGSSSDSSEALDAPAPMPVGHEARYETLGTDGCYGCHGYNSDGDVMLTSAPGIPQSHLLDETGDIDTEYANCIMCHVQAQ